MGWIIGVGWRARQCHFRLKKDRHSMRAKPKDRQSIRGKQKHRKTRRKTER
jgi:hypothetical protein